MTEAFQTLGEVVGIALNNNTNNIEQKHAYLANFKNSIGKILLFTFLTSTSIYLHTNSMPMVLCWF